MSEQSHTSSYLPWGLYPRVSHKEILFQNWRSSALTLPQDDTKILPFGLGRSYGDSCLNENGALLDTSFLNHFIRFDSETGILSCESGVTLATILERIIPHGWFLPVTPGTKFVTVGGAIANDVHGKNHHRAGTFGCHVLKLELLRSDGSRLLCSPTENEKWYRSTIGGLGLTGLITWAEIQLKKISNSNIEMTSTRFSNLNEFFELSDRADQDYDYTVAWIDGLATGKKLGRGLFLCGNHAESSLEKNATKKKIHFSAPCYAPSFVLNPLTIRCFNHFYYHQQESQVVHKQVSHDSFFYPLDAVTHWNRIYGKRGFFQYQCVIPEKDSVVGIQELMKVVAESGQASFLAVLKKFGSLPSPGFLSFSIPGTTLALDFPNCGEKTLQLMETLDGIVKKYGGRVYPAKDARMSAESFKTYFPQWKELIPFIDPKFSSSFWRRVTH